MQMTSSLDAIVIGSGPNGLAAAIAVARAGRSVRVYEAASVIGGATKSLELTLPGYVHDFGAAVYALVPLSPFLRALPLAEHGLSLVTPDGSIYLIDINSWPSFARVRPEASVQIARLLKARLAQTERSRSVR